ncbi:hypothetical protein J6590_063061 [Homalodisca vitripennis]|nr:hypothetical protein J6590_063061 [Homalodisca vitripennis]
MITDALLSRKRSVDPIGKFGGSSLQLSSVLSRKHTTGCSAYKKLYDACAVTCWTTVNLLRMRSTACR